MEHFSFIMPSDISTVETTVNKSRFIGVVFPVENQQQVKDAISSLRKSNKDAKHIAYAYLLGEDFSLARSNDDGEPAGSAGAPIYQAIREKKITNILVAVVRFFGGVELGKSKLTRVYLNTAANAIANARKVRMVYCNIFEMKCSYGDFGNLSKSLTEKGFEILDKNYNESMPMIKCAIPENTSDRVLQDIRVKLKDSAQMIKVGSEYYRFPIM